MSSSTQRKSEHLIASRGDLSGDECSNGGDAYELGSSGGST
eukprot:CAMPEP_0119300326 /NCGR_PEP_ID=MMETSP1333-20130426/2283_1 /TAXON_ID=418940 /ORGANISM="Scyphosphaera apsteinii, Strain RCC1455" /LENGTH=40 /DNA_ID= /DNA_START= /DNA_END= /DNA_ORIENTATION=